MKRILVAAAGMVLLLGGCAPAVAGPAAAPAELTVFAASSLTDAFTQIAQDYEAVHPGTKVLLNFGASRALRIQIEEGARADVFASANRDEVKALVDAGLVDEAATPVFARNRLVVVLPAGNPAALGSLRDLARPGLRLVVADPAVPAGQYTLRALDSLAGDAAWGAPLRDGILGNIVSREENVRAVLAKVEIGEADAGFVYRSDAVQSPALPVIDIPSEHNPLAEYPIAALLASPNAEAAQAFIDFVRSASGQATLEAHGFLPAVD